MRSVLPPDTTRTLLAYFDESGDTGFEKSPSRWFCLSCLIVPVDAWQPLTDRFLKHKRQVRDSVGFQMRIELKASQIRPGTGPWKALKVAPDRRIRIYRSFMELQRRFAPPGVRVFTVAIDKRKVWDDRRSTAYCVEHAWDRALQRLNNFACAEGCKAVVIPDSGHFRPIRRQVRKIRRFNPTPYVGGGASRPLPFENLLEDPVERDSRDSHLVQLADLNAYAAHRLLDQRPGFPHTMWESLGDALLTDVNGNMPYAAALPGIVKWPNTK